MEVKFMHRAIELARRGEGHTSPNPMVGCVIVKKGRIVAEGFHERYGGFHAERNALHGCSEDVSGADLYVTLEPCCHHGKTPPCTDIIIEKGIGRVFVGSMDTNPLVNGRGVSVLRESGIEVVTGILEEECRKLNEVFYHFIARGEPFAVMKYAMTLDGKIACAGGDSRWITGKEARGHVHRLREIYAGIMVGIGTVLADDPMLNCRIEKREVHNPTRIICDSTLRIPVESRIVNTAAEIPTIVACSAETMRSPNKQGKIEDLSRAGVRIIAAGCNRQVDMRILMRILGAEGIDSLLIEGGGKIHASALEAGIVSKVYAYISGKIVGGRQAPSPVDGAGILRMSEAIKLKNMEIERFGDDFCICGYPVYQG